MSTQPRKPAGSPNATGGQYDFKTGMDQPPRLPAAYFDGSMDDDERAMWAEGIDAAREGWADNHQEFDKDGNMTLVDGCQARVRLSMLGNTFVEICDTPTPTRAGRARSNGAPNSKACSARKPTGRSWPP